MFKNDMRKVRMSHVSYEIAVSSGRWSQDKQKLVGGRVLGFYYIT